MNNKKKAVVIGAGILGLATARKLSLMGFSVSVIERSQFASGSSIRNFGMVWPIGQPQGELLDRALNSREIWLDICKDTNIWHDLTGSVQLFTNGIELQLAESFFEKEKKYRNLKLLSKSECMELVPSANSNNVVGGLYSDTELIIESREAIRQIPKYLNEVYQVEFHFNTMAIKVETGKIETNLGTTIEADVVVICSGYETELLFPNFFKQQPITISQLNMLRSYPIIEKTPAICAGLSFLHYSSYATIDELDNYKIYCEEHYPDQIKHGIHLLVSQNYKQELTIGDSHEYGSHFDPFQINEVDMAILDYFDEVFNPGMIEISQHWMGQYLKMKNGASELVAEVLPSVFVLNGPGGAGMTLGWGMAEAILPKII